MGVGFEGMGVQPASVDLQRSTRQENREEK